LKRDENKHIKLCTFSRVLKENGIEEAISAVKLSNKVLGKEFIKLDIYGVIDPLFEKKFLILLNENVFCNYRGVVKFDETSIVLKDYFAMLFLTYYHGEGFAGNVIDAFYSGLPIIATNWMYNSDVIIHNTNGLLVPINDIAATSDAILKLYHNRELHFQISKNNINQSMMYDPDVVMEQFNKVFLME